MRPGAHHCRTAELMTFAFPAVLPDADRMHHSYVNMVFDNDPTAEHERLAKLSNKQRRRISGERLVPCQCWTLVYRSASHACNFKRMAIITDKAALHENTALRVSTQPPAHLCMECLQVAKMLSLPSQQRRR